MKQLVLGLIKIYQSTISEVMPPSCRFTPTCSHYSYQAIERFGLGRGLWLTVKRLARCNPFSPGGYDPVPEPGRRQPAKNLEAVTSE
ncbi:MAG: membrane protein insertion efficiency factor YidD [Dehalococcoidia bacterium]|nr:membrane protein insertion efficiency factor YidD [Dehalococcoidia bacterium]